MSEPLYNEIFALYAAVTDEDLWHSVLERTCDHLGATGMGLLFSDRGAMSTISSGIPEAEIDALRVWASPLEQREPGLPLAWRTSGYPHWLLPGATVAVGFSGHHFVVRLNDDGETAGYADLYRQSGAPDFDAAAIDSFVMLAPHLTRALALALRMAAAESCGWRCAQCSDMLPFGVVILDGAGSVTEMNQAASKMLTSEDGLFVADTRLHAMRAVDEEVLGRRIGELLDLGSAQSAAFISVPRPSGRRCYAIFMTRMSSDHSVFRLRTPCVRLVIIDTDRGNHVPRELLRTLYELTEAESRVAWHLASGATPEQAAERLGIAHSTLRHHLERIFAKTGVHRQSDLVRMVHEPFLISICGMT